LCGALYGATRPFLIQQNELDALCQTVAALHEEAAAQRAAGDGAGRAVEATLARLVADAQERLIYVALLVMRDEIERFVPAPSDLDYPGKLRRALQVDAAVPSAGASSVSSLSAEGGGGSSGAVAAVAAAAGHESLYASWYAPLRSTLVVLSKIYRAVDVGVFEDLAGEAVGLCTDCLKAASSQVTAFPGNSGDPADGDLFLVKHLLVLREQLTPFDINFSQLRRKLDFSSTRTALAAFWRGTPGSSIFSLSRNNALLELARVGLPSVDEHLVDAKHDLEDALKRACTRFIAQTTADLVEPLVALVAKSKAFTGSNGGDGDDDRGRGGSGSVSGSGSAALPGGTATLRAQAFASADRVRAALQDTLERCGGGGGGAAVAAEEGGGDGGAAVGSVLGSVLDKMALFLDSPVTRGILFKPVQRKVAAAVAETRALLNLLLLDAATAAEFHGLLAAAEQAVAAADLDAPPSPTPPPPPPAEARARAAAAAEAEAAAQAAAAAAQAAAARAAAHAEQKARADAAAAALKLKEAAAAADAKAAQAAAATKAASEKAAADKAAAADKVAADEQAAAGKVAADKAARAEAAASEATAAAAKQLADAAEAAANHAAEADAAAAAAAAQAAAEKEAEAHAAAAAHAATRAKAEAAAAAEEAAAASEAAAAQAAAVEASLAASAAASALAKTADAAAATAASPEDAELAAARTRLTRFYAKHNPDKMSEVDGTLAKFKGRFGVLFQKLNQKYGTDE
jgi:hypothetical protein